MKAIVYRGAQLIDLLDLEMPNTSKLFKSHRLSEFLPGIKVVFEGVRWTWDTDTPGMRSFEEFSELVRGIEELDPDSFNFRYPTDTGGQAAMKHHTIVNPIAFSRKMDPILGLLAGAVLGLTVKFDVAAEPRYELQSLVT